MSNVYDSVTPESIGSILPKLRRADILNLEPGIYRFGRRLKIETPDVKLISKRKWSAWFQCGITMDAEGVTLDGIRQSSSPGFGVVPSRGAQILNCLIHNNARSGIHGMNADGCTVARSLIQYNGSHPQYNHGIYLRGSDISVTRNLVRHNSGWNIHLFSPHRTMLDGHVSSNVIHGSCVGKGLLFHNARNFSVVRNTVHELRVAVSMRDFDGRFDANIAWGPCEFLPLSEGEFRSWANIMQVEYPWAQDSIIDFPYFYRPDVGLYWPKRGSPAIDSVTPDDSILAVEDFLGVPNESDIGAYKYDPRLVSPGFTSSWYNDWPYQYGDGVIPDPWEFSGGIQEPR